MSVSVLLHFSLEFHPPPTSSFFLVCCSHQGSCQLWRLPGKSGKWWPTPLAGIKASSLNGSCSKHRRSQAGWLWNTSQHGFSDIYCHHHGRWQIQCLPVGFVRGWLTFLAAIRAGSFPHSCSKQRKSCVWGVGGGGIPPNVVFSLFAVAAEDVAGFQVNHT